MANLASSAVTVRRNWRDHSNKYSYFELTIVVASMGGATNKLLASAMGLSEIRGCTSAVKSDNTALYPASPSYDGTYILLSDGALGVADVTSATVHITVWGVPVSAIS